MKARSLHANAFVERVPDFTPWIATNEPPQIQHADMALWRRLVAVPFESVVAPDDEDTGILDKLLADSDAPLWLVEGWNGYCRDGLVEPPAVVEATMRLREELSPFDRWVADQCELAEEYQEPYQRWRLVRGVGGA